MQKLVTILLCTVFLIMHVLSYAEQRTTEEKNKEMVPGNNSLTSDSLLSLLKKEEDRINTWNLTVEGSFTGDKADDLAGADVNIATDISKGMFPRQFRFTFESNIWFKDGKLEDDVTALLLNYDYYIHRRVEVYAFLERFSDSYMDIKRRFEIGFGLKLDGSIGLVDTMGISGIERLYNGLTGDDKNALEYYKETILTSMKRNEARLNGGIAFSFFRELEQAEIDEYDTTLPAEQRFRFVVRPSARLRVTRDLSLEGMCYLKLPAFEPRERNGELDYRVDAHFMAKLTLSEDKRGNEKVSINVRYNFRYDNAPPSVELNGTLWTASKSHGTTKLGICVSI